MSQLYLPAVADTILPGISALTCGFSGLLAQAAEQVAESTGDGAAAPSFFESLLRNPISLFAGLMILFYVLVLLPERRKQAEIARRRADLKKNDRVLTSSGIYGTVVGTSSDADEITLRVDDSNNTRIRVTRSSIASVLPSGKEEATG